MGEAAGRVDGSDLRPATPGRDGVGPVDVLLFSKTKALTGATRNLVRAFGRQSGVASVRHVNHRNLERRLGKRLADRWIRRRLARDRRRVLVVNHDDARVEWIESARERGDVVAYMHHAYTRAVSPSRMAVASRADLVYVACEQQMRDFEAEGVTHAAYLCRGCSTEAHYPETGRIRDRWKSDVAFIGRPRPDSGKLRNRLMRAIDARFDLKLYGGDWERIGLRTEKRAVYPRHYRKICAGARIVVGISDAAKADRFEDMMSWRKYTSNREQLTLGCGAFLLTNHCDGIEEVFEPGVHLDYYRSLDECLEKIEFYLARPELRERIARQGCELVRSRHTFDHFAARVVEDARGLLARPNPPIAPALAERAAAPDGPDPGRQAGQSARDPGAASPA